MAALPRTDRWLLVAFLPLFAVVMTLHAREVARTGLAQPPVYAAPPSGPGGYPSVGGFRLERGQSNHGLQVGDRLISVGGEDLAGVGYLRFDGIVLEHAGVERRTSLVYERGGVRGELELEIPSHAIPWFRIPVLVAIAVMATVVLLRAPSRTSRAFFAGAMALVILETPFFGGSREQSLASALLFNFGGTLAIFLLLRALALFPEEVPEERRASTHWAWLAVLHTAVRLNYMTGFPLPTALVPMAVLSVDALLFVTALGLVSWNYAMATPIGRRRLKWSLLGIYVGTLPILSTVLLGAVGVELPVAFARLFEWSGLMAVAVPIGILVAVLRYNLFDIDQLWSATARTSLLVAGGVVLLLGVMPELAAVGARLTGLEEGTTRLLLAVALGAGLIPAQRFLREKLEDRVFPRRRIVERGVEELLGEMAHANSADDVLRGAADRLSGLMGAVRCAVFVRAGERLESRVVHGELATRGFGARSPLALRLQAGTSVLEVPREVGWEGLARDSGVRPSEFEVLLAVRNAGELSACVALGPLRSGDVYTRSDVALLRAVAERASAELRRLADQDVIRSERLRAERLSALKEAAEEAQATRSRFLAAASHDLRQPLHALGMYADLLEEQLGTDRAAHTVTQLRASAASLSEMFSSLLDLSRLDVGGVEPDCHAFSLDGVLAQLAADAEPLAAAKGLALEVEMAGLTVYSDPVLLARILRNLLVNAIAYTSSGVVALRTPSESGRVSIEVIDTGPGIAEERRGEIFEEFVRGAGAARDHASGLGLGLTIVERLARQLGHTVEVDAAPGGGACFRVAVRRVAGSGQSPARVAPGSLGRAELKGRVIVVVEDELEILEAMRDLLEGWGCRPVLAGDGDEAVAGLAARRVTPDAVLADYRLASGTGLQAIAVLRARFGAGLPAAIISGETGVEVGELLREAGLPAISKPASPARLRATLLRILGAPTGAVSVPGLP